MTTSLIRPIAVNVNTGAVTYSGSIDSSEITDGTVSAADLAAPLGWGALTTGRYYLTASQNAVQSVSTLGVGNLRVTPWFVPNAVTVSRIGAEIVSAGDSGSKLRLGIYADDGTCYPGALVLDAGTIAADSNTVQEITVSQALTPGLYWVGAAVQIVSVTQPTVRCVNAPPIVPHIHVGAAAPSAAQLTFGFVHTSVTGALPTPFTSTVGASSTAPARIFVKV